MTTNVRNQRGRRSRRRYDNEPPLRTLGRAAAVLAVMAVFAYLAATLYSGVPLREYKYVEVAVPDPGSLIGHDPVRIRGARAGQVVSVGTADDGDARIRLQLSGDTELTADAKVLIRANGLLGARYVELIQGHSKQQLAEGQVIRGNSASLTYGVTEALDVLDAKTRGELGSLIGEAGLGVQGQGRNLNDTFRVAGDVIAPSADLFAYLRTFPQANARLLPALAAGARPLDASRLAIGQLFGATADALAPIPEHSDATAATIAAAPGALRAADSGLQAGGRLVHQLRSALVETRRTLQPAPRALRATSVLLDESRRPLQRTNVLLRAAKPAVPALLRLTRALDPVLDPLLALTDGLKPIVDTVSPYGCDIENLGVVMRSMTGFGSTAPGGPAGPPMQFRLQSATATGFENVGMADPTGRMTKRESYPPPCKYLSKPYQVLVPRSGIGGAR